MRKLVQPGARLLYGELEVLRRDAVGERTGLVEIARMDERAARGERGGDGVAPRHLREQAPDRRLHLVEVARLRREQEGLRGFVVLGLREKIHRDPIGGRGALGDHQDLRGPGDHVDAHVAEYLALRLRHIEVAGTDDLVDARQRLRAVGERGHRVGTAHGKDAVDAGKRRRGEHQRVWIRAHHDELFHAGDLGGYRIHEHRRRVRSLAAGHVQADALERRNPLAEACAVGLGVVPGTLELVFVETAYALLRRFERLARHGGHRQQGFLLPLAGNLQLRNGAGARIVKPMRILQERGIPSLAHCAQNVGHHGFHGRVRGRVVAGERRQRGIEARRGRRQATQLHSAAWAKASISGWSAARLVLSAAWLTISRADTRMMSSTASRSFALSVLPVETRSTMASARPTSGASSIDPYSRIRSTWTPLAAKCSRVMLTYFVATLRRAPLRTAPS